MRKLFTLFLVLLMVSAGLSAQNSRYLRVKIQLKPGDLARLAEAGIPTDAGIVNNKDNTCLAEISEQDFEKIRQLNIDANVLIDDLSDFYFRRNEGVDPEKIRQQAMRAPSDYEVPYDFELGSCGGFCTIEQCYAHLDHMADLYPDLITVREPISSTLTTINGEPIYYVKISDNANQNEDEPQVLYTGMHHAREPIGMQQLLFYMYYILEHYDTDPDIKALIDNTEMYFIPIFNVDGYQYNINTNPGGGGMWRKNRRNNGSGTYGVDLNRNYGYFWGYDNTGSSPYPSDETYRGASAFSEPENQMMKEFCESHNFKTSLNYHSYANLLLYQWGYTEEICPDDNVFAEYSGRMTVDNHYTYGPGSTTIYPTNGGSDDWMYGEQTTKNKMMSFTSEIGGDNDGFWPQTSRIIPLCQENMLQDLMIAKFAGPYAEISDQTPTIIPEKDSYAYFNLQRLGQTSGTYTVSLEPLTSNIVSTGDPVTIGNLSVLETAHDSIALHLSADVQNGDTLRYVLVLGNGTYTTRDTIQKYYGIPVVVFADDIPDKDKWSGGWGLYGLFPYSAPYSMADSPSGNYTNNANNSITLNENVSLLHASVATLSFYARWRIEPGYDYVQVKVSTNDGSTWTPLQGRYTHAGSSNQLSGQPLYDGIMTSWVREEIDLSPYAGQNIKLRFTLRSDQGTVDDGYYFDDLAITIIDVTTGLHPNTPADRLNSLTISPNPASGETSIRFNIQDLQKGNYFLTLTDPGGKSLMNIPVSVRSGEMRINTSSLAAGMYFCCLISEGRKLAVAKLMVY